MDRFLEEQEGVRDRSSSPNVHCLLYGDTKRQRTNTNLVNHEDIKSSENWDGPSTTPATSSVNNGITDTLTTDNSSSSLNLINTSKLTNQSHSQLDIKNHFNKKPESNQITWTPTTTITNTTITAPYTSLSSSQTSSATSLLSSALSSNSSHLNITTSNNITTKVNEVVIRPPENIITHLP